MMNVARYGSIAMSISCATVLGAVIALAGIPGATRQQQDEIDVLPLPLKVGHPTFASPHFHPIAISNGNVFVANTQADTVDVIDSETLEIKARVRVGIDPVSVVVRPDGREVWVANHVSDSVSVIDASPGSLTYLKVVSTIQEFDVTTKATTFDEPVGIAFANDQKAYVALSSENQIAVVDVSSRKVTHRLQIAAQDPRGIVVRDGKLFVIPFESNNKTQLSGGRAEDIDGDLVTFDAWEHSVRFNNVLSLGHVVDIVKHPEVPDRDLFVFDTATDELVQTVDGLGTLLYGLTVDSKGHVFLAQTDARNEVNGRAGTEHHGMKELGNRAFLNQITRVDIDSGASVRFDLEPQPPQHPEPSNALATPYGIQVSQNDSTLVAVAAGSNRLFTVDAESGTVLGRVAVGGVPRGVALECDELGGPEIAWVYNAVADTVTVVDLSDTTRPMVTGFVKLEDPTPSRVKLGRTWFNSAAASSTGTFSCESCHPDNNTDQLLWVLQTPIVTGADQIMPRSTMPVRGLQDTAPFHWDGVLGDPYGGNNSASVFASVEPSADADDQTTSTRHLIDASLGAVMRSQDDKQINDEGKPGVFSAAERDDLALYLLSVPFPPAQRRAYDNVVSEKAMQGFKLFHIDGDDDPTKPRPNVCGNCHRMPFLVSTNTPGTGMDAPTWRGAYDRFLILPQGRLNIIEFPFYRDVAERGNAEEEIWRFSWAGRPRFNPVWDMVLEGSTGFSGAFARQVTLGSGTVNEPLTAELLSALEASAREGAVVLEGEGVFVEDEDSEAVELQFAPDVRGGVYVSKAPGRQTFSREQLIESAGEGKFVGTFTGRHGALTGVASPQPALWTLGSIHEQRGRQQFPILYEGHAMMEVSGRHFASTSRIYVDGRCVRGTIEVTGDDLERVVIRLDELPNPGMHLLQVQAEHGSFSNDFIFHVTNDVDSADELRRAIYEPRVFSEPEIVRAVKGGDLAVVKRLLADESDIDSRQNPLGETLLFTAAIHDQVEIAEYLLSREAGVNATSEDGNTALHGAAFLCRERMVTLLLEHGASAQLENLSGMTPIDIVSAEWDPLIESIYVLVGDAHGLNIDMERLKQARPFIANQLRRHLATDTTSGDKEKQ